jgi:predicted regulator of Ras-like GTPase activity (Roadblock/LC7/MglB family)
MTTDKTLRDNRMVFYKDVIDQVDRILGEFLRRAGARTAILVDKDGHLITRQGDPGTFDVDTISALVANAFAATREMAKLLGEREFSALFHQGARDNIQLSLVGDRAILTVLFDDSTTLGMVRLYVTEAVKRLGDLFDRTQKQIRGDGEDIAPSYGVDAKAALDRLFQ